MNASHGGHREGAEGLWGRQVNRGSRGVRSEVVGHRERDAINGVLYELVLDRGLSSATQRVLSHEVRALLLRKVEQVSWDETPLGEVLDWLRAQSTQHGKVNVVLRSRALAAEGIDRDSPVTLELEDVTVAEVLREVLSQLSGSDPLSYVSKGNVLRISTKSDFRRKQAVFWKQLL